MKTTHFILVTFLLFPLLSYTQTDDNPIFKSFWNNLEQKTRPQFEENVNALYTLDRLKFKIDKIQAFKNQYNKLHNQLEETRKLYYSIKEEPIPAGLEKQSIQNFVYKLFQKHIESIDDKSLKVNNFQNNFIYLTEMTGTNKVIENETDLDKIMKIYIGFENLTKYHNYLVDRSTSMYSSFELKLKDETGKYDENAITCNEIKETLVLCDEFEEKARYPYLKDIDSISIRFELLPKKHQNFEVIPIRLRNDVSQKINKLILEYRGQESTSYYDYSPSDLFDKFNTDFTARLREKAQRIKKRKCL
ncbi:hypothetical protein [Lacinutrix sp. MedPE-SW]|uniref:hypothetical protein n=1 Tax=Lacinutrix sp. MedPE-SW TaxID=1860087 RepID=UPI0009132238|nr:hypothetical protein [Lacinutrix sp. MedPE-SW]OIQ24058.1 MAG: hypothetical protein BM549_01760 [Lacinutrix sp. MedPE-SW]